MPKKSPGIFDGIDFSILKIVYSQGPPEADEIPVEFARRLIKTMNEHADGRRTPLDSAINLRLEAIQRNIDRPEFITARIERAKKNQLDYDALKAFCLQCLRDGKPLPPELVDILDETIIKRPTKKGPAHYTNERRNFILAVAVFSVCVAFQIRKGRHPELTAAGECGFDIVAKAAGEMEPAATPEKKRIKFDAVRNAYEKYENILLLFPPL